jgi:hypothetical protein
VIARAVLRRFSTDSETFPIKPALQAPRVVCGQWIGAEGARRLESREVYLDALEAALLDPGVLIIGHRIAYDALASIASRPRLLPLWFEAYAADRVTCTMQRETLIRVAQGTSDRYADGGLLECLERWKIPTDLTEDDKKGDAAWRTRYHELDAIPAAEYPPEARRYALGDLDVDKLYSAQEIARARGWLEDEYREARADFALSLVSAHGMRVDPAAVAVFSERTEREYEYLRNLLAVADPAALESFCRWYNDEFDPPEPMVPSDVRVPFSGGLVRLVGSKCAAAGVERMRAVCADRGLPIPLTKTGKKRVADGEITAAQAAEEYVALDADATRATLDPILIALSRFTSITTLRGRAIRLAAAAGAGMPIQPRFDTLKKTGRTSCRAGEVKPGREISSFGDQVQNPHRSPGLRECYIARPGCVLISLDWKAAELGGLAQTCIDLGLGSRMAEILRSGVDIHTWFACKMSGWEYAWATDPARTDDEKKAIKAARQAAKACNFGFPGGLGIEKFMGYAAKQYQVKLTRERAEELRTMWLDAFPEMRAYFRHVSALVESGETLVHFGSLRHRGDLRYTAAANSYFQGRIADMLKEALFRIAWEAYCYGLPCRIWSEAHDEILIECPERDLDRVSSRCAAIMTEVARKWCPDAPPEAEPAAQRRWRKGAEVRRGSLGELLCWDDRPLSAKEIERAKKYLARGEGVAYTSWVLGTTEQHLREAA